MKNDWIHIINNQQNSGLSVREYCKLNHIAVSTFYKHKRKGIDDSVDHHDVFSSVELVPSDDEHISLTIDGHTLVFDPSLLDKVIGALK